MISKEERLERFEKEVDSTIKKIDNLTSNIAVLKSHIDNYGTMTITLRGGKNGNGEWDEYFHDLSTIVSTIRNNYEFWLIDLHNDCIDDIFYATFGIDNFKI